MTSPIRGGWRLVSLLVGLLLLVSCSPAPAAILAPPPSPTPVPIIATHTNPPPASPTPAATGDLTETAVPATATDATASTAATTASPTPDPAVEAIYSYLEARARADVSEVMALVCQAFQGQAATEAVSFRSMQARLEGIQCTATGASGPYTLVGCTGKIITTYGTETREWDQASFVYQAVAEEGAWKMCGYN